MTTLRAPVVRLADLFDDAGKNADRVLGPGPGPGARIVVEARQLAAIARQFGVDWRPASGGDRAVLERPGRPLAREEAVAALAAALASAGAPADTEIEIPGFDPPMVPLDGKAAPVVTQFDYDNTSGRFTAVLCLGGAAMDAPVSWRVSGQAVAMLELPVAATRLLPGTVLRAEDLRMAKVRATRIQGAVVRQPEEAIGMQLRHQAAPGEPLQQAELAQPRLVQRRAQVLMVLDSPGISVTASGQALDEGAAGDRVRVLNPVSHAVVEAEVMADGRVRVDPNALPLLPANRAGRYGQSSFGQSGYGQGTSQ